VLNDHRFGGSFWPFIVRQHARIVHPWPCRPAQRPSAPAVSSNDPQQTFGFCWNREDGPFTRRAPLVVEAKAGIWVAGRNQTSPSAFQGSEGFAGGDTMGRGLLLWLLGVPIPVIILLWLFFGH
jgi:hypothetical protein